MSFLTCINIYGKFLTYTTFILQFPQKTDSILGLANEFQSEIRIKTLFLDKAILIISEPAVSTLGTKTHASDF